jgi:hypothetical protein
MLSDDDYYASYLRHLEATRSEQLGRVRAEYEAGDLCLFVGAGVSIGCGLPGWKDLASDVVDLFPRKPRTAPLGAMFAEIEAGRPPPINPNAGRQQKAVVLKKLDPLLSMRYARADGDFDLGSLVSRRLYRDRIDLSGTILQLAKLRRVRRICCYNYDDLLDRAFEARRRRYAPVFENDRIRLETEETLIFYPHGFLPDPGRTSHAVTERIVLSEDDYFDLYHDPYAWANLAQLTLLLNYTALFVGCSMLDPNLRRLLGLVGRMRPEHRHFVLLSDELGEHREGWRLDDASAFRSVQRQLFAGLGVEPIWVRSYSEFAEQLRELTTRQTAPRPGERRTSRRPDDT